MDSALRESTLGEIPSREQPHDLHSLLGLANDEDTGNKICIKIADNGDFRESKNVSPAR